MASVELPDRKVEKLPAKELLLSKRARNERKLLGRSKERDKKKKTPTVTSFPRSRKVNSCYTENGKVYLTWGGFEFLFRGGSVS